MVHKPALPAALIVCGPSGVGKGTLIQLLMRAQPLRFAFAVSHTTRLPRKGEVHGREYFFTSKPDLLHAASQGHFVETAEVHGHHYGTSHAALKALGDKIAVLDLDIQGVVQAKRALPTAKVVGVVPPTMEILESRLRGRGTDSETAIVARLEAAKLEIARIPSLADLVIVNHSSWDQGYPELEAAVNKWFGKK